MDETEKLRTLLSHWKSHNREHAETYRAWAEKASSQGRPDLSRILMDLYSNTTHLDDLFEEAIRVL